MTTPSTDSFIGLRVVLCSDTMKEHRIGTVQSDRFVHADLILTVQWEDDDLSDVSSREVAFITDKDTE